MEEFTIAHQKVVEGNKHFIIVVLVEDLDLGTLPNELQSYLRTYTYIDAQNYEEDLEKVRKKIRYSMPGTPLDKIRQMQRDAAAQQENEEDMGFDGHENVQQDDQGQAENEMIELGIGDEVLDETSSETTNSSDDMSLTSMDVYEMCDVQCDKGQDLEADDHHSASPVMVDNNPDMIEFENCAADDTLQLID